MKKIVSVMLVCVLLVGTLLSLTSCGKTLTGTYKSELNMGIAATSTTYEFGIFGKVTCTINSFGSESVLEGEYEFNDAGDKITLTFENDEGVKESNTYDFSSGEEDGVKYIKIGIVKYTKVK